jgi:hypothetical protein
MDIGSLGVFKSLSIISRCPVDMNILVLKIGARKQNGDFLENRYNDFDYISVIYGE